VTEASPLRARRVVEVLATSAGGVGAHVRTIVPAITAAGASVGVCGAPATEQLFGFSSVGADFRPVGISSGLAPVADGRAVAQLRRATAGADLVHAHGLRAGLVAAVARRLAGERARPLVLTLHNALQESSGPRQRLLRAVEGLTIRGADLVLAVSSDLADNARRLVARDVRLVPALAPPLPPAARTRAEVRDELGVDEGRPLVVAVGRLHPQKGYDVLFDAVARWERGGKL
jgi:glycosyltransferase involved in cell wall biosynthesis